MSSTSDFVLFRGSGADGIEGTDRDDRIDGGNGNDRLWHGPRNNGKRTFGGDRIRGGKGNDTISAGGADDIAGGRGHDLLSYDERVILRTSNATTLVWS